MLYSRRRGNRRQLVNCAPYYRPYSWPCRLGLHQLVPYSAYEGNEFDSLTLSNSQNHNPYEGILLPQVLSCLVVAALGAWPSCDALECTSEGSHSYKAYNYKASPLRASSYDNALCFEGAWFHRKSGIHIRFLDSGNI